MKKPVLYKEASFLLGNILLAIGASLLVTANFGVSVVVAPAYLIHLKLSQVWSFVTFGVAEYIMQGLLLLFLVLLVRHFHWSYLFSFATTLMYGVILDLVLRTLAQLNLTGMAVQILCFILGTVTCAIGVTLMLHSYISPQVYELLIKEASGKFHLSFGRVKYTYDLCSCALAISLSLLFFGFGPLHGVGVGTVLCALVNGRLISIFSALLIKHTTLKPAFPAIEKYFSPPPFPEKSAAQAPENA